MPNSGILDSFDDSSTLPESSFDDLLDPSPIKKNRKSVTEDEPLEFFGERKNRKDDSLNTPGPKKPPILHKNTSFTRAITGGANTSSTPIRNNPIKTGNNTIVNVTKNNNLNTSGSGPVLLNTKNVLPKTATQITKSSIKLTPKTTGGTSNVSLAGKTAVRTSNGQIIYIHKTAAGASNIKPGTTSTMISKPQTNISAGASTGTKPMTIQVLRTADGNYVPIKTATSATNVKNTTLTLSPSSLAGKKIITSSGGQVLIKGPLKTTDTKAGVGSGTITTNAITGVRTMVRTSTTTTTGQQGNPKSIFVQGSNGKQIIVSNQNIVKLSPKTLPTTTTASGGSSSRTGTGQMHAIQYPSKSGVQFVRVLPTSKVPGKSITSVTTTAPSTSTTPATKTITSTNQPVKILNSSLPQKFTLIQKGGITTKLLVAQKKDVQKTLVTVPTLMSLNDDKTKSQIQQQPFFKSQQQSSSMQSTNNTTHQSFIRKHKISDINTEIQRITTTADNAGPPEPKKSTPNNRVVVISSNNNNNTNNSNNQPKLLNNSLQQPGRITTTATCSGVSKVQGTKYPQINPQTQIISNNKLYTLLKPGSSPKLYSVLKTAKNPNSTQQSSSSSSSIEKHYILQQSQKYLQLKKQRLQNANKFLNAATAASSSSPSSSYVLPMKIKEEPVDSATTDTTLATNSLTNSSSVQPLGSASEDSNKLDDMVGGVRRKHCNCSKSQCLKLYCDCFANGEFCQNCTCRDCCNNLKNEDERQRAIKSCLDRNPSAFKPKITSSREQADMRLHNKGCNCKRSGCLKNYCECYEAKIPCSSNCKCVGCRNVEDRPDLDMDPIDPKIMASIANVSANTQKRTYDKTHSSLPGGITIKTEKLSKEGGKYFNSSDIMGAGLPSDSLPDEKQQCNFITQEVIDATIQCMITQADECEKNGFPSYQTEKMVMEELGRCLVEIIDFSIRNTDNSYSQE